MENRSNLLPCDFSRGELTGGAWAHYGGNGDVQMMSDKDGRLAAGWDYDAFGRTVSGVGRVGDFGHRFSTKRQEDELGVAGTGISRGVEGVYGYGLRYYSPNVGRWMSEDPIGEGGGLNVYGMLGNDAVNGVDYLGMQGVPTWETRKAMAVMGVSDAVQRAKIERIYDRAIRDAGNVTMVVVGGAVCGYAASAVAVAYGAPVIVGAILDGAVGGYVGNGLMNLGEGREFSANGGKSALVGGVTGGLGYRVFRFWPRGAGGNVSQVMGEGADLAANYEGIGLVHMSEYADEILTSQKLGLPSDIYAGPISNASRSGCLLTLRTGLSPSGNYGAVFIPKAGEAVFREVQPVGIFTSWQRFTGQKYTARGIMDLKTGAFTRTGVNWNQTLIYGGDAAFTIGGVGVGIYLWKESEK